MTGSVMWIVLLLAGLCEAQLPGIEFEPSTSDAAEPLEILPWDELCESCTWRQNELFTCSQVRAGGVAAAVTCPEISSAGGYIPSFPGDPTDLKAIFEDGGMTIEWSIDTPNIDKLEGFYMKVTNTDDRTMECRWFDFRNDSITYEDLQDAKTFQYGCFADGFVSPSTQYFVTIQTIPVHFHTSKTFKSPDPITTTTTPDPLATTPPDIRMWQADNVTAIVSSWGAIEVRFTAAPEVMGVLEYNVTLLDASNNMTLKTIKPSGGEVRVTFPVLCLSSSARPVNITILPSAEDGKGGCLCVPDGGFQIRTSPCRHNCYTTHYQLPNEVATGVCTTTPAPTTTTSPPTTTPPPTTIPATGGPVIGRSVQPTSGPLSGGAIAGCVLFALVVCLALAVAVVKCKTAYKDVKLICGAAEEAYHHKVLEILAQYFRRLGINTSVVGHTEEDAFTESTFYLVLPPVSGEQLREDYGRVMDKYHDPPLLAPTGSHHVAEDNVVVYQLPEHMQELLSRIRGRPSFGRFSRSSWKQAEREIEDCLKSAKKHTALDSITVVMANAQNEEEDTETLAVYVK